MKSVRPHTVDLTDEFGAPVIAKRESREIVAGAATPTAAPATPAGTSSACWIDCQVVRCCLEASFRWTASDGEGTSAFASAGASENFEGNKCEVDFT